MEAVKREGCSESNCKILSVLHLFSYFYWSGILSRREMALRCEIRITNSLRITLNCKEDGRYYQKIKAKNAYQFANVCGSH